MDNANASTNANAPAPVIEMSGIATGSLQDQETPVLEEVNWTVAAGEYWVVAGMHGSGKSDLLALAAGLMPPQHGSYRLFGHEMPIYEDELLTERLRLGYVFDGGALFRNLTVAENIALPLRYHRNFDRQENAKRVRAMLELTELTPWADSLPGGLGRSWQKRAGLARALVLEPEILLLDNPLVQLDLRHANWWLNFLGQLSKGEGPAKELTTGRRMTLVATVEDLRPWRNRANRFALLREQRLVVLGERTGLADHVEPLVKELLAEEFSGS